MVSQYVVDSGKLIRMQKMEALIDTVMHVHLNGFRWHWWCLVLHRKQYQPHPLWPFQLWLVADLNAMGRALLRECYTGSLLL
jgi:hypothetical protein